MTPTAELQSHQNGARRRTASLLSGDLQRRPDYQALARLMLVAKVLAK